jgi:hypothetical protein
MKKEEMQQSGQSLPLIFHLVSFHRLSQPKELARKV